MKKNFSLKGMKNFSRLQSKDHVHYSAGFTLIEMIASVSIFTILMTIIVGTLISMSQAARKARTERAAIENISSAVDSMVRNIRVSTNYHCDKLDPIELPDYSAVTPDPQDCIEGNTLTVEPPGGKSNQPIDQVIYSLRSYSTGGRIIRNDQAGVRDACWFPFGCADYSQILTAPQINITSLKFFVTGSAGGSQSMVTIQVEAVAGLEEKTKTKISFQTTVSQRTPNFP